MRIALGLAVTLVLGCGGSGVGITGGFVGNTGGSGGNGGGTGGGGSSPTPCGDVTCSDSEVCTWVLWTCGKDGGVVPVGHCAPRPTSCDLDYSPVCACDGKVYSNACEAARAGVDLAGYGSVSCTAPDGYAPCGNTFCKVGESWCREEFEAGWSCQPLPEPCKQAGAGCECLGFSNGEPTASTPAGCHQCYTDGALIKLDCGAF